MFQLQFVDNTECFERLVKKWKLEYGKAPKEVKGADEDEEDEDKTDDERVGEGIDLKRSAYKPLKVRHPRSDSTFEDGEDENEDNFGAADAFIRTIETMASKLPFGSGRKAKRATYFLRQQFKGGKRPEIGVQNAVWGEDGPVQSLRKRFQRGWLQLNAACAVGRSGQTVVFHAPTAARIHLNQ